MKQYKKYLLASIFSLVFACNCYAAKTAVRSKTKTLAPVLQKVMPVVVNIATRGEVFERKTPDVPPTAAKFEGLGSGVIIDANNGYIITNAHVVKDARVITITLNDGRSMRAKVIGYDLPADIGVLQITAKKLKQAVFGDSDKLKVGNSVCAIGSPYGLEKTVTSGIVSGLERSSDKSRGFDSFIQTDASINIGSSGGALINMRGELIGINTAFVAPIPVNVGIGLAVPSNMAKSIADQIIKHGKVKRGVMGVIVQNLTPALSEAISLPESKKGALVSEVIENSPAAKSGLRVKDVIIKIMGKPVHSSSQVVNIASLLPIGSEIKLIIHRDGKLISLTTTVIEPEDLEKSLQESSKNLISGLVLKDFNLLIDNKQTKGVEVLYVNDISVAYSGGLRPGDVILSVSGKPVTAISELQNIADKKPKKLLLEVKRGLRGTAFLVLEE